MKGGGFTNIKLFSNYLATTIEINENICSTKLSLKYLQYGYMLYFVYLAEAGMVIRAIIS